MFVLTREEMYAIDKFTIMNVGIPGKELMENAGKGCSKFINDLLKPESSVAVFCGSGNNGGDGFVIARILKNWMHSPEIFLMGSTDKMSPETLHNYKQCEELNISINNIGNSSIELSDYDLIVDAIFGVGLKGKVKGWQADVIGKINTSEKQIVAIDIASGVDTNTGSADIAIDADYTLTMAAMKYGQILGKGREKSGEVIVIDIGVPTSALSQFSIIGRLATCENIIFPYRNNFSHKGEYGKIGIIAGSPGYTGAAILAAKAALRSGAGTITLFHPEGLETIFETQLLEVMTYPISSKNTKDEEFLLKLNSMDVLLIGPGIGISDKMCELLKQITELWKKPIIIDADAINIIAENKKILDTITSEQVLLTPHIGEFARLCDTSIENIQKNPLQYLQVFVKQYECSVLLKSATSIFCDDNGFIFNITGNNGLSTGGSGDVLAGIITSFVGQKLSIKDAAVSASYLLGETAEKLAEIRKPASIIPSDIIENIFKY